MNKNKEVIMAYNIFTTGWTKVHLPNNKSIRFQADLEPIDESYRVFFINALRFWPKDRDIIGTEFDNEFDVIVVSLDLFRLMNGDEYRWSLDRWFTLVDMVEAGSQAAEDIYFGIRNQHWSDVNQAIIDQLWL